MSQEDPKIASTQVSFLNKQNIVHALAYFPFFVGAISMYFLAQTNKEALLHHVKYSLLLSVGILILIFLFNQFFANISILLYIGLSIYFAFKAFKWQEIEVELLDVIEDKIEGVFKK